MASDEAATARKMWAILIGIDKYTHDEKGKQVARSGHVRECPKDLRGSVNDVLRVRHYLITTMRMDPKHIRLLLAPVEHGTYKFELPDRSEYEEPTYENMVKVLADVPKYAKKNDMVYIHYSGHGGQATTVFADLKKNGDSIDQSLMPTDVCTGRYLRDVELGALLQDMVEAGTVLTVVLDCCHSGGAIRGDTDSDADMADVRGEQLVCQSSKNARSWLAPAAEASVARWGDVPRWMESPRGFVVLAACLDYQKAKEMCELPLDYREPEVWHGRLTYWLLDTLVNCATGLSAAAIHARVCAKIENAVRDQTPYLVGEVDRFFFGPDHRAQVYAVPVKSVELHKRRLTLAGGSFHGVRKDSEYAILPLHFELDRRIRDTDVLARVRIQNVLSGTSTAIITDETPRPGLDEGCPAVLQSLPLQMQSAVRFVGADDGQRRQFEAAWTKFAKGRRLLRLLESEDADDAMFTVTVEDGCFQIKDRPRMLTGTAVAQLRPLRWDAGDSMPWLVRRLEHVARYHLLRRLANPGCPASGAQDLIDVDIAPAPEDVELEDGEVLRAAEDMSLRNGAYDVPENRLFRITVTNKGTLPVACTILNFTPELGIEIVYPDNGTANYDIIPGSSPGKAGDKSADGQRETKKRVFEDFYVEIPDAPQQQHQRQASAGGTAGDMMWDATAAEATTTVDLFKVLASRPERDAGPLRLKKLRDVEMGDFGHRGEEAEEADASLNTLDDLLNEFMPVTRGGKSVSSRRRVGIVDWQTKDILVRALRSC